MRKNPFEPGVAYRLIKNLAAGSASLMAGEILTFVSGGYSPYDDCYVYEFSDSSGEVKILTLPVDAADASHERLEQALVKLH
jgi:hypothetical protein